MGTVDHVEHGTFSEVEEEVEFSEGLYPRVGFETN